MEKIDTKQELTHLSFNNRELEIVHSPYEKELAFYDCIKTGDIEAVKNVMTPLGGTGFGHLSNNEVRNLKYHLVITIAFVTRFCIEGGMEQEEAYSISDLFIQKMDLCITKNEIDSIHREMVFEFTNRMAQINKKDIFSKPIVLCLDYIYTHLHSPITLDELATKVSLSPQYLSKLFHKEKGITLSMYIQKKRVEAAKNMLRYSDYSLVSISNYLSFSTYSYFISAFKKWTGYTPKEYRNKYFRNSRNMRPYN